MVWSLPHHLPQQGPCIANCSPPIYGGGGSGGRHFCGISCYPLPSPLPCSVPKGITKGSAAYSAIQHNQQIQQLFAYLSNNGHIPSIVVASGSLTVKAADGQTDLLVSGCYDATTNTITVYPADFQNGDTFDLVLDHEAQHAFYEQPGSSGLPPLWDDQGVQTVSVGGSNYSFNLSHQADGNALTISPGYRQYEHVLIHDNFVNAGYGDTSALFEALDYANTNSPNQDLTAASGARTTYIAVPVIAPLPINVQCSSGNTSKAASTTLYVLPKTPIYEGYAE